MPKNKLNKLIPKKTVNVEGYPLVSSDSEGLTTWFNNNPNIAGMAIGAGLNGINGNRRVVLNPNLKDINARNSVYRNESYRHFFDENNTILPEITNILKEAYIGTPYEGLDRRIQETEVSRYLSGDPSHHLNRKQKTQLNKFRFTYPGGTLPEITITGNKHKFGGNLFLDGGSMNYKYRGTIFGDDLKNQGITHVAELPEVTVTGYAPLRLTTYYPVTSEYPYTGHSKLDIPIDRQTWYNYVGEEPSSDRISPYMTIDKESSAKDYNLITNNCADATLSFLNNAFGTSEKPWLFTTPGDVRDYALKELDGKLIENNDGSDTVLIPRNAKTVGKLSTTALNMFDKDLRGVARLNYKGPFNYTFNHTKPGTKKHPYKYQNGGKSIDSAKYFTLTLTEPNGKSEYQEHIDFGYTPEEALSYARETEKRFADAPNSGYIAGELPEVVVTPGYGNATTLWHLLQMIPSKKYRKKFAVSNRAGIVSDNEYIDRMYELWKASKKPDWKTKKSFFYRPYYNVLTNTITAPAKNYLAELSHAYQYQHLFPDLDFNYLGLFGDIKIGGKSGYDRVNNPEYQAHSIIAPVLSNYVQGEINYKDIDPTIKKRLYKAKHSLK